MTILCSWTKSVNNKAKMNWNKKTRCNKLYMAGGGFSGLTSQTLRPPSCGSDTPDCIGTARPHTIYRYLQG